MPTPSSRKKESSLFKETWTGYLIIMVHLLFVVTLAAAIIFIQALADYIGYVIGGGLLFLLVTSIFFYRQYRKNSKNLINDLCRASSRHNHDLKIDFMGGLASISIHNRPEQNGNNFPEALAVNREPEVVKALPESTLPGNKASNKQDEILRLADLYDRKLISEEEFTLLKKGLFASWETKQEE